MDEQSRKRNTDCVYFLASPLTCKKGSGCEFRHSEAARKNPRDCRYWFSGNCLNLICPFRHPPLDAKASSATTLRASATSMPSTFSAAGATLSRYKIPCYYFSQGYCAKGGKCPFMHGLAAVASTSEAHLNPLKMQTDPGINNTERVSVANEANEAILKQDNQLKIINKQQLEGSNDHTHTTHKVSQMSNPSVRATKLHTATNVEPSNKEEERNRSRNDRLLYMQELVRLSWQNQSKEMKSPEPDPLKLEHQSRNGRLQQGVAYKEMRQKGVRPVVWPRVISRGLDGPDQTNQGLSDVDEPQPAYDRTLANRTVIRPHNLCHVSRASLDVDRKESWVMNPACDTGDLRHHLMKRRMTGNAHYTESQNGIETFQQQDHIQLKRPCQGDYWASVSKHLPGNLEDFEAPKPLSVILKEKRKASRTVEGVFVSAYEEGKLLPSKVVRVSGDAGDHGCFIWDDVAGRGFNQYHK